MISLLTSTPRSSPSLVCRRCEKMGNSYFVPGCSSLRVGSKRRRNAVRGRAGDAGLFESSECLMMPGEVEALEHVTRELRFFMSVIFVSKIDVQHEKALTFPSLRSKKISSIAIFCCYSRKVLLVEKIHGCPAIRPETISPVPS